MADLSPTDKRVLEKLFEMGGGYVCDFSNRTLEEFVLDVVGIDIYQPKYEEKGTSKANRLRTFWQIENNHTVAALLDEMISYEEVEVLHSSYSDEDFGDLRNRAREIIAKLKEGVVIEDVDVFQEERAGYEALSRQIQESVDQGRPEEALDRLHTFLVRYARDLCKRHRIQFDKKTPLHGLFGSYVNFLRKNRLVESRATLKILSSSVKVRDSLSSVRNDHSLAHDNSLLDRDEATLIFRNIASSMKFIKVVEARTQAPAEADKLEDELTDEEIDAAVDQYVQLQIDIARGK